jgi:hypothetical protein
MKHFIELIPFVTPFAIFITKCVLTFLNFLLFIGYIEEFVLSICMQNFLQDYYWSSKRDILPKLALLGIRLLIFWVYDI